MGKYRDKKNYRQRFCKIEIAKDCRKIFTAVPKRAIACPECKKVLKRKGTHAFKYWELKRKGFTDEEIFKNGK